MLETLTAASFAPLLHDEFTIATGDGVTLPVQLIEVTTPPPRGTRPPGVRESFSLIFRGAAPPFLPQGTHAVAHPALGSLDLFLVPIGPDEVGHRYQAVFG